MATNSLMAIEKEIAKRYKTLDAIESEIIKIFGQYVEEWVKLGFLLKQLREQRLYETAGFGDWKSYAESGRLPQALQKAYADRLILAAEVRPFLVDLTGVPPNGGTVWTEYTVRPLTTVRDPDTKQLITGRIKLLSRAAVKEAESKGVPLTAALVSEHVKRWKLSLTPLDDEEEEEEDISTPEDEINEQAKYVRRLLRDYQQFPAAVWAEVSESQIKKFVKALRELADFLDE